MSAIWETGVADCFQTWLTYHSCLNNSEILLVLIHTGNLVANLVAVLFGRVMSFQEKKNIKKQPHYSLSQGPAIIHGSRQHLLK